MQAREGEGGLSIVFATGGGALVRVQIDYMAVGTCLLGPRTTCGRVSLVSLQKMGRVAANYFEARKNIVCSYPHHSKNHIVIVVCFEMDFINVQGWNCMNDSENELWPKQKHNHVLLLCI